MSHVLHIIRINLINGFRRDTAYFAENWSNVFSTMFYTAVQLLFIEFLFGRIDSVAGYTKNDVYLLLFVSQLQFYLMGGFSFAPAAELAEKIGNGLLDFILTRPVPTRLFMFSSEMSIVRMLRDAIPPLIPVIIIINWSELNITVASVVAALVIFICGLWLDYLLVFMLMLINMWTGSSAPFILNYFWSEHVETKIPFEATFYWFRAIMIVFLPALLAVSVSTSVMLQKTNGVLWIGIVLALVLIFTTISQQAWNKALRTYSSASS